MNSFLGHKAKDMTEITDEVIIHTLIGSSTAGANAYLNATLACATPELRAMYGSALNQMVGGNTAFTALSIAKGWDNPYSPPSQQLSEAYSKSKETIKG